MLFVECMTATGIISFGVMYYRCNMTLPYIKAVLTFDAFKPKFHSHPKNAVNSFGICASVYHCQNREGTKSLEHIEI